MPKAMLKKLPAKAKEIYESVYASALKTYDGDEARAAGAAIAAVKGAGYEKDEKTGNWAKKAEKMQLAEMYFTKASLDPETGEMRWSATVSKFEEDDEGDEVTVEFFKNAMLAVESGRRPLPAVCISHIDKGKPDDLWTAGDTETLFVDGERPKAKGTFRQTALGKAAFGAVQEDIKEQKPREERARISMGFFDEGSVAKADGHGRRYLRGWIKHLAMTRVPIVKEAEFDNVVQKAEARTAREDAESIVGKDLTDKLLASKVEKGKQGKELITKQEGKHEDQLHALLDQLFTLLGESNFSLADIMDQRQVAGNRGTNAPRAVSTDQKSEVDELVDSFASHVKSVLLGTNDRTSKFTAIQQGLDQFGKGVVGLVKSHTPLSTQDIGETVQTAVQSAVQPLQQEIIRLQAELEGLKDKSMVQTVEGSSQPTSMDTKVQLAPSTSRPMGQKARTAAEIAWETTREPRY